MTSDIADKREHEPKRQLHHYENVLTLESVRLEHSGLYSCVPSSGLPNATVNLHVVKGTFYFWLRPKSKVTNDILNRTYALFDKKIKNPIY